MRSLVIEVPDEVYIALTKLPKEERVAYFADQSVKSFSDNVLLGIAEEMYADKIQSQFSSKEEELADTIAAVNEGYADAKAGRTTSLEELMARYGVTEQDLLNAPDGLINGKIERNK